MADYFLLHSVELTPEKTAAILVAETEQRVRRLVTLAEDALQRRDPALLEAVFISFAGLPTEYKNDKIDHNMWDEALQIYASQSRAELITAFIEVDPRRAAECFDRYVGHNSEGFFSQDDYTSEVCLRALRKLGDTPEELAFIRSVFARALADNAGVVMDGSAQILTLADDTAAVLKKLRAVPAYTADVDAATHAIIRGLRDNRGIPEHIAIFERILPATQTEPPLRAKRAASGPSPHRPAAKRARAKPAGHEG